MILHGKNSTSGFPKYWIYCCQLVLFFIFIFSGSGAVYADAAHGESVNDESFNNEVPQEFDNRYQTKLVGFTVNVTNRLRAQGENQYELFLQAEAKLGTITETSQLYWDEKKQVFVPLHYTYLRRSFGRNKKLSLVFDWEKNLLVNQTENKSWPLGEAVNVQDKLSYQVQMQQDLLQGKKDFVYQVADKNGLQAYEFTLLGEAQLTSPIGDLASVVLKRTHGNGKRVTTAWLAKQWGYLLLRLEHQEKGKTSVLDIQSASIGGKKVEGKTNRSN